MQSFLSPMYQLVAGCVVLATTFSTPCDVPLKFWLIVFLLRYCIVFPQEFVRARISRQADLVLNNHLGTVYCSCSSSRRVDDFSPKPGQAEVLVFFRLDNHGRVMCKTQDLIAYEWKGSAVDSGIVRGLLPCHFSSALVLRRDTYHNAHCAGVLPINPACDVL